MQGILFETETSAQQYDMFMSYNPYYQSLHQEVTGYLRNWKIPSGSTLADIGAGTGNYSVEMARIFPQATILHFDNDEGMNAVTAAKRPVSMTNHHIYRQHVDDIQMPDESLNGLISIHALYTFPDPATSLRRMYQWLEPGAPAILVNTGRIMNVLSWQIAIGWYLLRHYGLRKSLDIMRRGKEVSRQNAHIRDRQRRSLYWTHTHREFVEAVRKAGFEIELAKKTFRKYSDLVVVRKSC